MFFQQGRGDLYRFDDNCRLIDNGNVVFINETVPGFPQNVTQISYGTDAIYLLVENVNDFEIWQFDGQNLIGLVIGASLENGQPEIKAIDERLYLLLSHFDQSSDVFGQCAVYQLIQGELVLQAEQKMLEDSEEQDPRCESRLYHSQGHIFIYFEYSAQNRLLSSFAELSLTMINLHRMNHRYCPGGGKILS